MKRYAVLGLALLVGVLAGFVVDGQQTPTLWEYGRLTQGQMSGAFIWAVREGDVTTGRNMSELGARMGCGTSEIGIFDCVGSRGWEYVGSFEHNEWWEHMFKRVR